MASRRTRLCTPSSNVPALYLLLTFAISCASASSFQGLAAGVGGDNRGYVEVQPRFFVNDSDPTRVPDGAPAQWPLDYELFRERDVAASLIAWLRANGVQALGGPLSPLNIEIDYNTTLRGSKKSRANFRIVARRNISAGELFASMPLSLALTTDIAEADSPTPIREGTFNLSTLAAWILRQRAQGEASPWHPYLASLPQHLPVPILYDPDLLAYSEYPKLINETQESREQLEQQYALLGPEALGYANFSEFVWAFSVASSRLTLLPGAARRKVPSAGGTLPSVASASASEAHRDGSAKGAVGAEPVVAWEDEFLLDEDEALELEASLKDPQKANEVNREKEEEDKAEILSLLPLLDLFDWDEKPSASWEVVGSSVVLRALKDIAAGEAVLLRLPEAQNEEHLVQRGFVPRENVHDGALLFQNHRDAIWYFREKFLSGKFNDNYLYVLVDTFELAVEFIEKEVKEKKRFRAKAGSHIEYRVQWPTVGPTFAWWGAIVDPGPIASIAAGHSITINNKTPDYWFLAPTAMAYGWIEREGITCDSLSGDLPDKDSDSLQCAGTALLLKVLDLIEGYTTSRRQDDNALRLIRLCSELSVFGRTSSGEDFVFPASDILEESCPDLLLGHLAETEAMFLLKKSKKTVLIQLGDRLKATCSDD